MRVKGVSLTKDKSLWSTVESQKNLIYQSFHLENINSENIFTVNFQDVIQNLFKQEDLMKQHIINKAVKLAI